MTMWLRRLDLRDRALFGRWVIGASPSSATLLFWRSLTHVGGTSAIIVLALAPLLLAEGVARESAVRAVVALAIVQVLVQAIKRSVVRTRPSVAAAGTAFVALPDRFSFPSGHAASVMAVALVHAATFHALAIPLFTLAVFVGASRVRLGVHYPGDVLVGQVIAIGTGAVVCAWW